MNFPTKLSSILKNIPETNKYSIYNLLLRKETNLSLFLMNFPKTNKYSTCNVWKKEETSKAILNFKEYP